MKIVIDVAPSFFERLSRAVEAGGFASIGQFTAVALENQLSLESDQTSPSFVASPQTDEPTKRSPVLTVTDECLDLRLPPPSSSEAPLVDSAPAVHLSVEQHGWIWGIVNRVFPIKVAARSLLLDSMSGPVSLESARTRASDRAHYLGAGLGSRYGADSPGREDSLLTGLPTREPVFRAKDRFADHFFGRIDKSGRLWGAMFELGLAATVECGGEPLVALTSQGLRFATLPNPVLDDDVLQDPLSADEIDSYVDSVVLRIPREGSCFVALLGALALREMGTDDITEVASRSLPSTMSTAAVQTMKAGALGRMHDLRLTFRVQTGRSARFSLTQKGEAVLARLNDSSQVTRLVGSDVEGL